MALKTDPLRDALASTPRAVDPPDAEVRKESGETAATGAPAAGQSTAADARSKGPAGVLQLLGPGLITGASDDDPSGIGTYSQVGSQFGYGLLWTALLTFPLMTAVQELCARIALQTGTGLGLCLRRRFPTPLVGAAILLLIVANTINIGADLGAVAAGGQLLSGGRLHAAWLIAPVAALVLGFQLFSTYRRLLGIFKWLTLTLFAYVVTAFLSHPHLLALLRGALVPHIELNGSFIAALVAILGTTISPYLFFWQASSEVEEMKAAGKRTEAARRGVRRREMRAARLDIVIGMAFSQVVMVAIIVTSAAVLNAHGKTGVQTAQDAASALTPLAGRFAFVLFSVGLIGTGLLAIPVLSGAAAYALKEFAGFRGGLADRARYRPTFYLILVLATLAGVGLNLVGLDPIRALFVTAVINGVVAPPLLVLITILGADRSVMGERTSGPLSRTLTWLAAGIMSAAAIALGVTLVVH